MPSPPALPRFLLLYAALFAAFGVASPFLPGLLLQNGLTNEGLGVVLAAGTAIRLVAGPAGGRLADWLGRPRLVLAGLTAAAALIAPLYGAAWGFGPLLLVVLLHAVALAPLTPVADALALGSAREERFAYGWVRGAGSAAFIGGALLSGQTVGWFGLDSIVWQNAALLAAAAACALLVPNRVAGTAAAPREAGVVRTLLGIPVFARMMVVASLVGGSHALHDAFAVVRWRAAGLTSGQCSALWSLAVAAEVAVFMLFGPGLLARLGPGRAAMLAAVAGVVRWAVEAESAWWPLLALVEPLHGFTFALLHLVCMAVIAETVPARHAAVAQAFYATVALGAAGAAMTALSGPVYGAVGARGFWVMAALCLAAMPVAAGLRRTG